ncbi:CHAT domain-containing protein [Dendronalium sp. ChiSLP03b]|uniref:CHAT domain-containing protein n=1 Tax=Dendronalium sp. ChiSLP03b TaxID=3075381 RepID=UPI00391A1A82
MIYRWHSFTILSLIFYLTVPLAVFEFKQVGMSQVLTQKPNNQKAEADKLFKQGDELSENNQPQAALQAFQKAVSIYQIVDDKRGESKTNLYIGSIYANDFEQYNQAITYYQKALDISRKIDNSVEAKALNNLGLMQFHLGNSPQAIEYCEQALAVARKNQNYETEAIALKSLGVIYMVTDTSKGLDLIKQSLIVLEKASGNAEDKLRQNRLKTTLLIVLGNFHYSFGANKKLEGNPEGEELLNKSIEYYQKGLKIAQEMGDRPRQGKALLGIADVYYTNNQYTKSVETLQQALNIFSTDKNFRSQARFTHSKLGDVYHRWGNRKEGLNAYEKALEIIKTEVSTSPLSKLEQDIQQAWLLIKIGNIHTDTSIYQKAITSYLSALEILKLSSQQSEKITTPLKQVQISQINLGMKFTYLRLCFVYKKIGQVELARGACKNSRAINITSPLPKSLSNKGTIFKKVAKSPVDIEKAKKDLQEALANLQQSQAMNSPDFIAFHLAGVGAAYTKLGEYKQAEEYLQKAIKVSKTVESLYFKPYIFFTVGQFYDLQNKYDLAFKYYQQAGEFANHNGEQTIEATIFKQIGITGFLANRLPEATTALSRAINVFDSIRNDLLDDETKISIFETQANTYSLLQKTLISQNKFSKALEVAERGRARAFINLLALRVGSKNQSKSNLVIPNVSPPSIADIQRIAKEQNATIVEYAVPNPPRYNDANNNDKLVWDNSELYIWVIKPTGEISFRPSYLKPLWQQQNISLRDKVVQARQSIIKGVNVASRGNNITFAPGDRVKLNDDDPDWEAWQVVSVDVKNGKITIRLPSWEAKKPAIERPIADVVKKIGINSSGVNAKNLQLQELYQLLIQPIADILPKEETARVIFIPQDALFLVPFPALQDPSGQYLIDKHTILTAPSIQVLESTHKLRQKVPGSAKDILIVGNPTMPKVSKKPGESPQQLGALPGSEKEAIAIALFWKTQALIGNQATKNAVLQKLPLAKIIHLATHGLLDDIRGLGSSIVFAPEGQDNGLLTAEDILNLYTRPQSSPLSAELVILSACDTGQGRLTGDGVIGLSRSIIAAGVPSIIVSLWSIPDAPTAELMTEFYGNFRKNPDKATALRQAMLTTKKKHPSPADWAAFTLIGESE